MSNRPNRQQRRAEERKQEAYATIEKLTAKAVKPKRTHKLPPRSLAAIFIAAALLVGIGVPAYFYTASTAPVTRHVPPK